MKNITASDNVYVGKSKIPNSGRGVFAKTDIKKGKIIESCPMIEIPKYDKSILNGSILVTYFFYFGKNKRRVALALGYGSIYNHSDKANAKFRIREKDLIIEFIALNDIKKNEEITFNYRGFRNSNKSPLWFEIE